MPKVKDVDKLKHPKGRKTIALLKSIKKTKSREKSKMVGSMKLNILGEKVLWFRDNLDQNSTIYTRNQVLDIITKYLGRFDEELEQIQLKHSIGNRKNRQHASREDIINMTKKNENEEFNSCGLEIPDLFNAAQFDLLKKWNGELRFLQNFKLKRFNKKFLEQEEKGKITTEKSAELTTTREDKEDVDMN